MAWTQVEVVDDIGDVGHSICVGGLAYLLGVLRGAFLSYSCCLVGALSELMAVNVG